MKGVTAMTGGRRGTANVRARGVAIESATRTETKIGMINRETTEIDVLT